VGALLTGCFATKSMNPAGADGAFYGNWYLLWAQVIAVIMAILISVAVTAVSLLVIQLLVGLRTAERYEEDGLDDLHEEKVQENSILKDASEVFVHKIKDFPWKEFFTGHENHSRHSDNAGAIELETQGNRNEEFLIENVQEIGVDDPDIIVEDEQHEHEL